MMSVICAHLNRKEKRMKDHWEFSCLLCLSEWRSYEGTPKVVIGYIDEE